MTQFPEYTAPELRTTYVRDAFVYDLYDGDTVYYHADLGYGIWAAFQIGRLLDCWCAEIRPLVTRAAATSAKEHLLSLMQRYALNRHNPDPRLGYHLKVRSVQASNKWFEYLKAEKKGKYGRWLVVLLGADDEGNVVNLNERMVHSGHATQSP
jgi:hypothetical protein